MPTEEETKTPPAEQGDPAPEESPTEGEDTEKLLKALRTERDARAKLEQELKAKGKTLSELETQLDRKKEIDPEKYADLMRQQKEREEKDLERKREYEQLKTRYQETAKTKEKEADDWRVRYEGLKIDTAVEKAFYAAGGKTFEPTNSEGAEDIPPVETLRSVLSGRIRYEGGNILIVGRDGNVEMNAKGLPKSLDEKMLEFKKGTLGDLFRGESSASGGGSPAGTSYSVDGKPVRVATRESAQKGRVDIDAIAAGKTVIK